MSSTNDKRKTLWEDISNLPEEFLAPFTALLKTLDNKDLLEVQKIISRCSEADLIELQSCKDMESVEEVLKKRVEAVHTEDAFSFLKKSLKEKMGAMSGHENKVDYTITPNFEKIRKKGEKTSSLYYFELPYQIELVCGENTVLLEYVYQGTSGVDIPKNISAAVSRIRNNVWAEGEEFVKMLINPTVPFYGIYGSFVHDSKYMEVLEFLHGISPYCDALEKHMCALDNYKASTLLPHFAHQQLDLIKQVSKNWRSYSHELEDEESYAVVFGYKHFIVWTLSDGVYTQNGAHRYNREMPVLEGPLFKQLHHEYIMTLAPAFRN